MTNRKGQITDRTRIAAVIGGGVIGGGWAARFLLNGWNVHIFDSDSDAAPKILDVLENARASLPLLADTALPEEGQLVFCDTLKQAASGALWIQESVPERLLVKKRSLLRFRTLQTMMPLLPHLHLALLQPNCAMAPPIRIRSLLLIPITPYICCLWLSSSAEQIILTRKGLQPC